jgi:DnaK suppressor protein
VQEPSPTLERDLDERRVRTQLLVDALGQEIDEIVDSAQLANVDDEHDPDGSTIAYERAKASALLAAAVRELEAIDLAVARARAGSYGTCTVCGGPIAPERLEALPTTGTCITCASAR